MTGCDVSQADYRAYLRLCAIPNSVRWPGESSDGVHMLFRQEVRAGEGHSRCNDEGLMQVTTEQLRITDQLIGSRVRALTIAPPWAEQRHRAAWHRFVVTTPQTSLAMHRLVCFRVASGSRAISGQLS